MAKKRRNRLACYGKDTVQTTNRPPLSIRQQGISLVAKAIVVGKSLGFGYTGSIPVSGTTRDADSVDVVWISTLK